MSDKTFSYTLLEKDTEPKDEQDDADVVSQLPLLLQNVELDDTSLMKAEQNVWKLASKEALVLPFSFCYQTNGEFPVRLPSYLPIFLSLKYLRTSIMHCTEAN